MEDNILDWYNQLNEEEEGIAKITVPVLDAESESQVVDPLPPEENVPVKPLDPVVEKDKGNALMAFVMAKKIQDMLVRVAGLSEPYETDSEARQEITSQIKELYKKLGENIASL